MKRTAAKILCIILMQVGLHAHLAAQDRPFRIGFQASPVFSGMRNKDDLIVKNGGNLGLKLGAISDIYFKNNLSFTLGLNLAFHEGGEFLYEIGGNYLPDSELSDPFFEAPILTFSFLTRGRGDIESKDFLYEQENIYKDLIVANIFFGLGAGVEYAISKNNSLIGGLYWQRGLFDVTKDNGWRAIHNPDIIPTYLKQEDDSRATVGNLILCLGILF